MVSAVVWKPDLGKKDTMNTESADKNRLRKPELLAPAGTWDSFIAALDAGADAIYLGLDSFNARQGAENFTLETLALACRMAHLAGRRVYLTFNILIATEEMERALVLLDEAYLAGIDAVIVQDIGLIGAIGKRIPGLEIHTSTQMNLCNRAGMELAGNLGASRVTLARELTLDEIAQLATLGIELEVFAHGALCVCYSGQCLMSSLIGRRSANRGRCAQPCRLPWELVDASGEPEQAMGEHLLSTKDLCTVDILPSLMKAGVASLKIEGRMKSPEYVSLVCGVYRSCIDRAFKDPASYRVSDAEHDLLEEAFSRGFTTAYLEGERGNAMMSYKRPNNRGVLVGRVAGLDAGQVFISLTRDAGIGDVLEFWTSRGCQTLTVTEICLAGKQTQHACSGQKPSMVVPFPVATGDRVFRVRNARLAQPLEGGYGSYAGVPTVLDFQVSVLLGHPLAIQLSDHEGRTGMAAGALVQPARTKAISRDDVIKHVGRLGSTPYIMGKTDVDLDDGVGLGFSQLHHLRTQAIEDYESRLLAPWAARQLAREEGSASHVHSESCDDTTSRPPCSSSDEYASSSAVFEVAAVVSSRDVLRTCLEAGAKTIYIPVEKFTELGKIAEENGADAKVICLFPTIMHDKQLDLLGKHTGESLREPVDESGQIAFSHATVSDDLASIAPMHAAGNLVEAGPHTNVFNIDSLYAVREQGACRLWLSPELSLDQVDTLAASALLPLSITVFGRQELMVTEHCVLQALGECDHDCQRCARRAKPHSLLDRKGYAFPVTTDSQGRGHVFNSVPLDIIPQIPRLAAASVSRFIVDAQLLTPAQTTHAVSRVREALRRDVHTLKDHPLVKSEGTTTGHLFRGVL